MNLSVVVVDDEPLIRSGLRAIINAEEDLTVVGEAGDGAEVLPLVRRTGADVVLMDVRMPAVASRVGAMPEFIASEEQLIALEVFKNTIRSTEGRRAYARARLRIASGNSSDSLFATVRMPCTMSAGGVRLRRNPEAPARSASYT